jgi:hypothetical protein
VTESIATAPPAPEPAEAELPARTRMVESVLDNLSFWFVVSAAIGLLYLVWATIEILDRYVGGVPKLTP